ncbi:hypothetical protein WH47_11877 [Habropoda laboriosa]|uniref:Uncharacterized protein n=1 Tax=Habropoda laboriosa TaxID=597456 RepID=A0A0L7R8M3_9HYME|nr:hypothetical protein WH47_11877 [Habropoda laboriosa]
MKSNETRLQRASFSITLPQCQKLLSRTQKLTHSRNDAGWGKTALNRLLLDNTTVL